MRKSFVVAALLALFCTGSFADELYLKSGEILNNEIIKETSSGYIVKDGNSWREISKDEISFVNEKKQNEKRSAVFMHTPELIIKVGYNFMNEITSRESKNGNMSFDVSDSIFFGADFYVPLNGNLSLGAGAGIDLKSNIKSGYGNFFTAPVFASAKIHTKLSEKIKIYTSFNFGLAFINSTEEFLADDGVGYDPVTSRYFDEHEFSMKPYYGVNFGVDIDRMVIELGFSYTSYKVTEGNDMSPDDINVTRGRLSIGYRI